MKYIIIAGVLLMLPALTGCHTTKETDTTEGFGTKIEKSCEAGE